MSDIVQRLRAQADRKDDAYSYGECPLLREAANEIECLREAVRASYEKLKLECGGAREYKGGMPTQVLFPMLEKVLGASKDRPEA